MRAILIVPVHKIRQLLAEGLLAKWYYNDACTFLLETQDESLNNRDAPVPADGARDRGSTTGSANAGFFSKWVSILSMNTGS